MLDFNLVREQARVEIKASRERKAKWLRGLLSLLECDPLSLAYKFTTTFEQLDVQGAIIGGDGSGGPHSSDPRLRKRGFGLVVIRRSSDNYHFDYLGHSYGSVPGLQTVPRAEATAILQALRTTRGNALFVADNWSVVSAYNKGDNYSPNSNGLLWQAIKTSRGERLAKGFGFLEVVWIKAHLSFECAINNGFDHYWWIVNSYAEKLADQGAAHDQLGDYEVTSITVQAITSK